MPHAVSHKSGRVCMKKYWRVNESCGGGVQGVPVVEVGGGMRGAIAAERPLLSRQVTSDRCSQHM